MKYLRLMDNQIPTSSSSQPTPPAQPMQQAPPPVSEQSASFRISFVQKLILVFAGLILIASIISFFLPQQKQSSSKSQVTPTTVSMSEAPTPDPTVTANWQSFTSDDAQVSFKYPHEFIIREERGVRINVMDKTGKRIMVIQYTKVDPTAYNKQLENFIKDAESTCIVPTATRIPAGGQTSIKLYGNINCGGEIYSQLIIYSPNMITYDSTVQGEIDQTLLHNFLSTFTFIAPPAAASSQQTCTAEAKICPDGSSVGRVPPSCEFAACP